MTAVDHADGTFRRFSPDGETTARIWVSPSTMDSANTVVLPTFTGKTPRILACHDQDTGDQVTASISSQTVTIDSGGATTDHTYVLTYAYI